MVVCKDKSHQGHRFGLQARSIWPWYRVPSPWPHEPSPWDQSLRQTCNCLTIYQPIHVKFRIILIYVPDTVKNSIRYLSPSATRILDLGHAVKFVALTWRGQLLDLDVVTSIWLIVCIQHQIRFFTAKGF